MPESTIRETVSPDFEKHLRSLSSQISIDRRLDAEIQRELFAHMEDKALSLLGGTERLSEEDAFLLVREHFGDPAIIRGMMHNVYPTHGLSHLIRRLAAIICVSIPLLYATNKASTLVFSLLFEMARSGNVYLSKENLPLLIAVVPPLISLPQVYLLFLVLRHWNRRIATGASVWFFEWSMFSVVATTVLCFSMGWFLKAGHALAAANSLPDFIFSSMPYTTVLVACEVFATALIWIWWCDSPPRLRRSIVSAAVAWWTFEVVIGARTLVDPMLESTPLLREVFRPVGFSPIPLNAIAPYLATNLQFVTLAACLSMVVYSGTKRLRGTHR